MIENNGNVPLQLDWLFGRNSVSKSAVLQTEWVFESDLVSKMPNLLTELVSESDLVSKCLILILVDSGVVYKD